MTWFLLLSPSPGSICMEEKSSGLKTLIRTFCFDVLSNKADGPSLKHPGKCIPTGKVLVGNKPTPSLLHVCNMTSCSSKGSRAGSGIPELRTALLHTVQEGPSHLNCKNPKIYMGRKTSPE